MHAFRNGFTLIEIISILIVLGVLALVSVAFFRNDGVAVYAERDRLLAQLVYARAQGMAMGGGQCVEISDAGVSFPVRREKNTLPAGSLAAYSFPSGVSASSLSLCFDAAGSACAGKLEDANGTGILYCAPDQLPKVPFVVDFGGKVKLEVYSTGFVQ